MQPVHGSPSGRFHNLCFDFDDLLQVLDVRYMGCMPHVQWDLCPLVGMAMEFEARWGQGGVATFCAGPLDDPLADNALLRL